MDGWIFIALVLSTTTMAFFKIDGDGVYRRCPGVTFISFLEGRQEEPWLEFYSLMRSQPVFRRHFQPLPLSSLHMTIRGWMVSGAPHEPFLEHLLRDFSALASASDACARHNVAPRTSVVAGGGLHCSTVAAVNMQLDPICTAAVAALNADLDALGVPPSCQAPHMTLAYRFRAVPDECAAELGQELDVLSEALQRIVRRPECGGLLRFQPAALCFFPDMTEFVPLQLPARR